MTEVSSFILKCLKSSKMGQIWHYALYVHILFYSYNIFFEKKLRNICRIEKKVVPLHQS